MIAIRTLFALTLAIGLAACQGAPAHTEAAPVREVQAAPSPKTLTFVAMGASDVVGVGADDPATEGWAPVLAGMLGPVKLMKHGESGMVASELRERELSKAVAAKPDLVVLWTGPNDFNAGVSLAQFEGDLSAMLTALGATGARVVVVNLPALDQMPAFKAQAAIVRQALPDWQKTVRQAAKRHGATVVELSDYSAELAAHPEYLSPDGFHPSTVGYRRLAGILASVVRPTL